MRPGVHCIPGHASKPKHKVDQQVTIPFDLWAGDALGVKAPALIGARKRLCYDVQAHAAVFAGGHHLCGQGIIEGDIIGPIAIQAAGSLTIDQDLRMTVSTEAQASQPLQTSRHRFWQGCTHSTGRICSHPCLLGAGNIL